jgi:hypothetical protein
MVGGDVSPHAHSWRVAEELCERGFDARAFFDTDELGCRPQSGVAIHGICVVGWRYPNGRWEFRDHPPRLIEPDEHEPAGCWIWDDIVSASADRRQLSVTISDSPYVVATRVAELLPCDPQRVVGHCFANLWSWQQFCGAQGPKQWERDWREHQALL